MSQPPPPSDPSPPPPSQRNGCLQALAILLGIVLLLPGICAIILVGVEPRSLATDDLQFVLAALAVGAGGVALIWWAVKRPRPQA